VRVYRRYLKLEPTHAEEYLAYLKAKVRAGPGSIGRGSTGSRGQGPGVCPPLAWLYKIKARRA
jgi:hypothetical protein